LDEKQYGYAPRYLLKAFDVYGRLKR
jgi:hypothetical protein